MVTVNWQNTRKVHTHLLQPTPHGVTACDSVADGVVLLKKLFACVLEPSSHLFSNFFASISVLHPSNNWVPSMAFNQHSLSHYASQIFPSGS